MDVEKHEQIDDPSSKAVLDRITIICTVSTIFISTILLTSWFFDLFDLTRSNPIYKPMSPGSSLSFIVLGCALLVYFCLPVKHTARKLAKVAVMLILAFDLIILVNFIAGRGFDIERFIYSHPETVNNVIIGRMSPISAVIFEISGFALLLLLFSQDGKQRTKSLAANLASISLYFGIIVFIGYLYGTPFYGGTMTPTSLSTSIIIIIFNISIITAAGMEYLPLRLFIGDSVRARLMRSFIPFIIGYIVLEGILEIVFFPYSNGNVLESSIIMIFFFIFGVLFTSRIAQTVGGDVDRKNLIQRDRAADALHESDSKFRTIFETIPEGLGLIRLKDDLLIEANIGFSEMFGYTKDELIGINIRELNIWFDPDDKKKMQKQLQSEDFAYGLEVKFRKKNGDISIGTYYATKLLVNNEPHLIISTRDISRRKGLEKEREVAIINAQSEKNKSEAIIAAMGDGIIIQDTNYIITYQNKIQTEIYGEHSGEHCYKVYENRDTICEDCPVEKTFLDGKIHRTERCVPMGGKMSYYELTSSPLRDSSGKIIAGVKMVRDITDRKLAEEKLRESEHFLESIIESIQDGIGIIDMEMNIIKVNKTAESWYPYAVPFIGKKCYEAYHNRKEGCELCPAQETFRTGNSAHKVVPKRGHGGKEVGWLEIYSYPLRDTTEQMKGVIEYVRDITQSRLAEAERMSLIEREQKAIAEVETARKLDIMKSMFIASTSHELRTPLNAIIGFSSLILAGMSGEINEEQKMQIGIVHSSATHLLALISDVIDLSKIEAGKIDVNISQFDLRQIVNEAVTTLGSNIKEKELDVSVEVEKIQMRTDRMRLFQCLLNLIGNSVKYTEKGSIKVIAKKRDNYVDISVTDTGIGIKTEDIARLFEPFVRFESHLTLKTSGTGLGLYLTQKLAKDFLKGEIDAKSEYGKGSTFILKIPVDIQKQPEEVYENNGSG